jgi:hypothetical protein
MLDHLRFVIQSFAAKQAHILIIEIKQQAAWACRVEVALLYVIVQRLQLIEQQQTIRAFVPLIVE